MKYPPPNDGMVAHVNDSPPEPPPKPEYKRTPGQVTVSDLLEQIRGLLEQGKITPTSPVETQGCDCYGPCKGVDVFEGTLLLERGR